MATLDVQHLPGGSGATPERYRFDKAISSAVAVDDTAAPTAAAPQPAQGPLSPGGRGAAARHAHPSAISHADRRAGQLDPEGGGLLARTPRRHAGDQRLDVGARVGGYQGALRGAYHYANGVFR